MGHRLIALTSSEGPLALLSLRDTHWACGSATALVWGRPSSDCEVGDFYNPWNHIRLG